MTSNARKYGLVACVVASVALALAGYISYNKLKDEQTARDTIKMVFTFPDSVKVKDVHVDRFEGDITVCGKFSAANGFGTQMPYKYFFYMKTAKGVVVDFFDDNEAAKELCDNLRKNVGKEN